MSVDVGKKRHGPIDILSSSALQSAKVKEGIVVKSETSSTIDPSK